MYSENIDVRRIDMCIGEKAYWNKGIGTQFIGMMLDFAFFGEHVDILHCFCEDYNVRSKRMWEKHGFTQVLAEPLKQPQKGKWQYHYRLTRKDFIEQGRIKVSSEKKFLLPLSQLKPSCLCISEGKLHLVREWFDPNSNDNFDPISVKKINNHIIIIDGHTRAVAALLAGWDTVPVYWDEDDHVMQKYEFYLNWCDEEGIHSLTDLANRIVSHKDYQHLWRRKCMEMIHTE